MNNRWKWLSVIVFVLASGWFLYPSFRYYRMSEAQRSALSPEDLNKLRSKAIRLGLDLKGGVHLVLEVDRSKLGKAESADAIDRSIQVIRNRVDQLGVAEPIIQKEGEDRIVVQLPGILDPEYAKSVIGKTALLEFRIVKTPDETRQVLARVDAMLAAMAGNAPDSASAPGDTTKAPADTSLAALEKSRPLSSLSNSDFQGGMFFTNENVPKAMALTAKVDTLSSLGAMIAWSSNEELVGGLTGRVLYILDNRADLTGKGVATAIKQIGLDASMPNAPGVSLTFNNEGANLFSQLTGKYVQRQMAIVLDRRVESAPVIRERIRQGKASITGSFTDPEAQKLAIVIRAGALPAPVNLIEERTVGPSLGKDSIDAGIKAGLYGALAVVLFMIVYYRLSGVISILALILNIYFLMAIMAALHFVLTLPGIAGIVLTIGMAVDANVLVYERIREEMRAGKTIRAAIQTGYQRAFRTILDAHVTAWISSAVLFQFGTGPIKGFAVTLAFGLLANMYTAVLVAHLIFDAWVGGKKKVTSLSI